MLQVLLRDEQLLACISLLSRLEPALFFTSHNNLVTSLKFLHIIKAAVDGGCRDQMVINLIKLCAEEVSKGKLKKEKIDYDELFYFFIQRRKVKFMRFLLERSNDFTEKSEHFTKALDMGCEDMAMLLYKEFSNLLSHAQTPKVI